MDDEQYENEHDEQYENEHDEHEQDLVVVHGNKQGQADILLPHLVWQSKVHQRHDEQIPTGLLQFASDRKHNRKHCRPNEYECTNNT